MAASTFENGGKRYSGQMPARAISSQATSSPVKKRSRSTQGRWRARLALRIDRSPLTQFRGDEPGQPRGVVILDTPRSLQLHPVVGHDTAGAPGHHQHAITEHDGLA